MIIYYSRSIDKYSGRIILKVNKSASQRRVNLCFIFEVEIILIRSLDVVSVPFRVTNRSKLRLPTYHFRSETG